MDLVNKIRFAASWFDALGTALNPFIPVPWTLRWRLIPLQLLVLLIIPMKVLPYAFSNSYSAMRIPTRNGCSVRAIVFKPKLTKAKGLHVDFHGGAFVGGIAEINAPFCEYLCEKAGVVVVSAEYRHAPRHVYPAAHEDAEDVIEWCIRNASKQFGLEEECCPTVSGGSAGGNLMFVAGKRAKAAIGICPVVDLRKPPWSKRKPESMPKRDPLAWLMPLFDAYAGTVRAREGTNEDARLHPMLRSIEELPENVLMIVAAKDILYDEEMEFTHRVKREFEGEGKGRRAEAMVFPQGFHGWLELPKGVIDEKDRMQAWAAAVDFVQLAHERHA